MNEQSIKDILAVFLKQPAGQISEGTRIDRSAIASSIVLHRMYAKLSESGFSIDNYSNISTYGQLLGRLNGGNGHPVAAASTAGTPVQAITKTAWAEDQSFSEQGVGIDIESALNLPRADDFRESAFYQSGFTPSEISYCILQPDPYASFAGIFAAKEALVKAGYPLNGAPFNQILISHNASGAPVTTGFRISISHSEGMAVAVAIPIVQPPVTHVPAASAVIHSTSNSKLPLLISLLALIGAVVSVVIAMKS